MRIVLAVVLLLLPTAAFAQSYDAVVTGGPHCSLPPLSFSFIEWVGSGHSAESSDVVVVAPAPNGRVYGAVFTGRSFYVAQISPSTAPAPVTVTVPLALPQAMVVGGSGTIYAIYRPQSAPAEPFQREEHLVIFNPDGSIRADYPLHADYSIDHMSTTMDLARDQCTLFLIEAGVRIRRFNACTGTFAGDFATVETSYATALRILPDGGLLVAAGFRSTPVLERYTAAGMFVGRYALPGFVRGMMLTEGGTHLRYGAEGCSGPGLVTIDVATGTRLSAVPLHMDPPRTLTTSRAWTAALGNTHANAIPATGTVALITIAVLLGVTAVIRLR